MLPHGICSAVMGSTSLSCHTRRCERRGGRGCRSSGSEEEAYAVSLGEQGPWESDLVRLGYSSLVTPTSTYDVNVRTGECKIPDFQLKKSYLLI